MLPNGKDYKTQQSLNMNNNNNISNNSNTSVIDTTLNSSKGTSNDNSLNTTYNNTSMNSINSNNNSKNNNTNNHSTTNHNKQLSSSTTAKPTTPTSPTTKLLFSTTTEVEDLNNTQLSKMHEQIRYKDDKIEEYETTICDLRTTLNDRLVELNSLKHKFNKSPERNLTGSLKEKTLEREQTLERLKKKHLDVEKLKSVVETLMVANEEKNNKIDDLAMELEKFKDLRHKIGNLTGGEELLVECGLDSTTGNGVYPNATSTPVSGYSAMSNKSSSCTNIQQREVKTPPTSKRKTLLTTSNHHNPQQFDESLKDEMAQEYKHLQNSAGGRKRSTGRSIRRLFNRLRRSTSQEFNAKNEEFKRATTVRSTAGPRLSGWINKGNASLASWDIDTMCAWFTCMGLSCYVGELRRVVKDGEQLLNMSSHQMEKELGIKNAYHRRKIQLAMQVMTSEANSSISNMDHHAVQKWLDDIGLPQYKDHFMEARLDGRMLNYLTNDDLFHLKVTNQLHQLSIRSAIYVLRTNNFNINSLIRRPFPDEVNKPSHPPPTSQISLWTNHRVMDWLRVVDLCEYAPNLRGSGVHGGLMVLEPRFSAEILASILSIPSNKSLLRRHLNTHFVALVAGKVQQAKRTYGDNNPDLPILTTTLKVKAPKKANIFRSKNSCSEFKDDFVCPFDDKLLPWSRELLIASIEGEEEGQPIMSPDVLQQNDKELVTSDV